MNQGTKWVLLMQKNRRRKSHAWAWAPLSDISLGPFTDTNSEEIPVTVFTIDQPLKQR
jgi:hypothetical protein